ncbi:hypothetical protein SPHINGOT1_110111 [Sphingomonas sp. T1]|nr:hypothetical protein SPHINGOT1_110111 [Sphingomonas sp. T1]
MVEHATENRSVGGSTPSPGTIFLLILQRRTVLCGRRPRALSRRIMPFMVQPRPGGHRAYSLISCAPDRMALRHLRAVLTSLGQILATPDIRGSVSAIATAKLRMSF